MEVGKETPDQTALLKMLAFLGLHCQYIYNKFPVYTQVKSHIAQDRLLLLHYLYPITSLLACVHFQYDVNG